MPVRFKPPTSDTSFMPGRTSPGPSPKAEEWAEILAAGSGDRSKYVEHILPKGGDGSDVYILDVSQNIEVGIEVKHWLIEDPGSGTGDKFKFQDVLSNPPFGARGEPKEENAPLPPPSPSPESSAHRLLDVADRWLTGDLADEVIGDAFEQFARINDPTAHRKIALTAIAMVVFLTLRERLSMLLGRRSTQQ